jgi:hypothetical protein
LTRDILGQEGPKTQNISFSITNSFSDSKIFESSSIGKESLRGEENEEPSLASSPKKNSH